VARLLAVTDNNREIKIYVRGDQNLMYGKIMNIMGVISSAGFHKVSLLAELPQTKAKKRRRRRKRS